MYLCPNNFGDSNLCTAGTRLGIVLLTWYYTIDVKVTNYLKPQYRINYWSNTKHVNWGFGMGALPGGDIRQPLRVQMSSSGSSDPDIGSNSLGGGPYQTA